MEQITVQQKYTVHGHGYQFSLPLEMTMLIPADDSVRLLNAVLERMDYSKLRAAYSRLGRIEISPKNLFKVMVYGYMTGIESSRKLEQACRRDINFMYLLEGAPAPDHATIARFRSERLTHVIDDLFKQLVGLLAEAGELSLCSVFLDGTKIEANANRYTFVWKKAVQKNESKMQAKMKIELPELASRYGVSYQEGEIICIEDIEALLRSLHAFRIKNHIEFVYGKGKRKHPLQRTIETLEGYRDRQRKYDYANGNFEGRNSFSKTDEDATFMRLKEDHMKNGQLKPAYNVTIGVDAEYIVGAMVSQERNDAGTFIPMMEQLIPFGYTKPVADAGFESEENYTWCENHGQQAYIKPLDYERAKTRKYRSDIGRRENMQYDEVNDAYICHAGHLIKAAYDKTVISKSGYSTLATIYSCDDCKGCPHKERCIKGHSKIPLEERNKNLHVAKTFMRQRKEMESRINTEEGILLRINRSIQVEGAFGVLKQDMGFRRFLLRNKVKVKTEFMLLAMAFNINKLHNKIQSGRCGAYLHFPKTA